MLFSYLRAIETVSRGSLAGAIKSDGATPEANQLQDHVIPPLSIITCYFAPKCSLPLCMNTTVGVWICAEQKADTAVPCSDACWRRLGCTLSTLAPNTAASRFTSV
ncbi:unnamed protein product [Mesocestoides corti]|uniref:Uncharacterized protein n=1 Tax=Mesocestoides corti TaxID=53468 RepID=A0A0R3UHH0_MESCO|nr:unnamed protein product [Mesocestoides corti]